MHDIRDQDANTVLVGVDDSECADAALRWAADWAARRKLPLCALKAVEFASAQDMLRHRGQIEANLLARVAPLIEDHPGLQVTVEVASGGPTAALVGRSTDSALVVIGTRGLGGWAGLKVGGVAATVSAYARCPVVVVPPAAVAEGRVVSSGPVVVGVDGSPESAQAADFAAAQAESVDEPLVMLHSPIPPMAWAPIGAHGHPISLVHHSPTAQEAGSEVLDDAVVEVRRSFSPLQIQTRSVSGTNAPAMLAEASQSASLVTVGSRGRGGFTGLLFGSTGRDLLQRSSCPVAVVRSTSRHALRSHRGVRQR